MYPSCGRRRGPGCLFAREFGGAGSGSVTVGGLHHRVSGLPLGIRIRFRWLPGRLESGKCRSILLSRSPDRPAPLQPGFRLESHRGQSESLAVFACLRRGKGPESEQRWEARAAGLRGARAVGWTRAKAMAEPWKGLVYTSSRRGWRWGYRNLVCWAQIGPSLERPHPLSDLTEDSLLVALLGLASLSV